MIRFILPIFFAAFYHFASAQSSSILLYCSHNDSIENLKCKVIIRQKPFPENNDVIMPYATHQMAIIDGQTIDRGSVKHLGANYNFAIVNGNYIVEKNKREVVVAFDRKNHFNDTINGIVIWESYQNGMLILHSAAESLENLFYNAQSAAHDTINLESLFNTSVSPSGLISKTLFATAEVSLNPNPFENSFQVLIKSNSIGTYQKDYILNIYNTAASLIHSFAIKSDEENTIHTEKITEGTYVAEIVWNGTPVFSKIIIK